VSSPLPLPIDSPSAFRPDPGLVLVDPLTVPCFIFLADSREQLSSSSSPILSRPASQSGAARKDFSIGQLFFADQCVVELLLFFVVCFWAQAGKGRHGQELVQA
jgi:hypothetical protein